MAQAADVVEVEDEVTSGNRLFQWYGPSEAEVEETKAACSSTEVASRQALQAEFDAKVASLQEEIEELSRTKAEAKAEAERRSLEIESLKEENAQLQLEAAPGPEASESEESSEAAPGPEASESEESSEAAPGPEASESEESSEASTNLTWTDGEIERLRTAFRYRLEGLQREFEIDSAGILHSLRYLEASLRATTAEVPEPAASGFQVSNLDYDDDAGRLCIGHLFSGELKVGQEVGIMDGEGGELRKGRVTKLWRFDRVPADEIRTGDYGCFSGMEEVKINDILVAMSPMPGEVMDTSELHSSGQLESPTEMPVPTDVPSPTTPEDEGSWPVFNWIQAALWPAETLGEARETVTIDSANSNAY